MLVSLRLVRKSVRVSFPVLTVEIGDLHWGKWLIQAVGIDRDAIGI